MVKNVFAIIGVILSAWIGAGVLVVCTNKKVKTNFKRYILE